MKNTMKLLGIAVAVLLTFGLAGCDGDPGEEDDPSVVLSADGEPNADGSYPPGSELFALFKGYSGNESHTYDWYKVAMPTDELVTTASGETYKTQVEGTYYVIVKYGDKQTKPSNKITLKEPEPEIGGDTKDGFYGAWCLAEIGTGNARRAEWVVITKGTGEAKDTFDFFYSDVGATSSSGAAAWHYAHVDFEIATWDFIADPALSTQSSSPLYNFTSGYKLSGTVKSKNGSIGTVPNVGEAISYYVYIQSDGTRLVRTTPNATDPKAIQNDSGVTRFYTKVTP
jgi:hypothetical protein